MKKGPVIDISGRVYGKLTVIRPLEKTPRGLWKFECLCECGKLHSSTKGSLEHGTVKSCGCLKKQPRIAMGFKTTDGLVRQLMTHYRTGAKQRRLDFSLTVEEFKSLIIQECFYCGKEPSQSYRPTRYKSDLKYSGIDRVDNFIGYIFNNCVPCCSHCNRAKSSLSGKEFFEMIVRIYNRHLRRPMWRAA